MDDSADVNRDWTEEDDMYDEDVKRKAREWETNGKIESEGQSDGYYFMDAKTHQPVMVSGTCK